MVNVLRVDTDQLRAYGTGCARLGDHVAGLGGRLLREGEINARVWSDGHLTALFGLQEALHEMRDLYRLVRWVTTNRIERVSVALLNIGPALHAAADRYEAGDEENADRLARWA